MARHYGDGSIYRRKDGRYEAAVVVLATDGARKRVRLYRKTYAEARSAVTELLAKADRGHTVPENNWQIGRYLDYWLQNVAKPNVRPSTYKSYEGAVRRHLKPGLANIWLNRLSVAQLQSFFNQAAAKGVSPRVLVLMRQVLITALNRAMKEEIIMRNVARLVDLPKYKRRGMQPWTSDQAQTFLRAAQGHPLAPAFLLLTTYGLRRGEALGLRWQDIDWERAEIHVRVQLQRQDGKLVLGPVKTEAGNRDLPMPLSVSSYLAAYRNQKLRRSELASADGLIFTTAEGGPIEPNHILTEFYRICEGIDVPRITLHYLRHTAATLLKDIGVAPRDAQVLLGHAHVSTTQQIYQHGSSALQREAIDSLGQFLVPAAGGKDSRQTLPSTADLPTVTEAQEPLSLSLLGSLMTDVGGKTTGAYRAPMGSVAFGDEDGLFYQISQNEPSVVTEVMRWLHVSIPRILLGAIAVTEYRHQPLPERFSALAQAHCAARRLTQVETPSDLAA